jgi:hypothetical protein
LARGRNPWGPLTIIITLLAVLAIIFGFIIFGPPIFSSAYGDGVTLNKYANKSAAGNSTIIATQGLNSLFVGLYSGPLSMLSLIVGAFLVIATLVFVVVINRRGKKV